MVLRKQYTDTISQIYDEKMQMRLMAVMLFDQNQYTCLLKIIELLSSIIESSFMECNPKRMLKFLILLKATIDELNSKIDKDYKKMWDNKLTH